MKYHRRQKSQLDIYEDFSSEEFCYEYFLKLRWPNGFKCPACECTKYSVRRQKYQTLKGEKTLRHWMCSNKDCNRVFSLLSGTILSNSKTPLKKWVALMFLMVSSKQGVSAMRVQSLMGFKDYGTALRILWELRRAIYETLAKNPKLKGEIELDETNIGREDTGGKKGKASETMVRIIGAVERVETGLGRVRMEYIDLQDSETILAFAKKWIEPKSTIFTDNATIYAALRHHGYTVHSVTVTPTPKEKKKYQENKKVNPKTKHKVVKHLPGIHRIFSLFKRVNIGTHQGTYSDNHLSGYLYEYCFRFEYRNHWNLFHMTDLLIQAALQTEPKTLWQHAGRTTPYPRVRPLPTTGRTRRAKENGRQEVPA